MSDFLPAAKTADVPENGKLCIEVDDRYVVIVNLAGDFFCVDDVCSHDGGTLGDGEMDGACLVCPRHGAKFDARTGEAVEMPATEPIARHEVKVDGDMILVKLSDD